MNFKLLRRENKLYSIIIKLILDNIDKRYRLIDINTEKISDYLVFHNALIPELNNKGTIL